MITIWNWSGRIDSEKAKNVLTSMQRMACSPKNFIPAAKWTPHVEAAAPRPAVSGSNPTYFPYVHISCLLTVQ